jgi:hypothetical protein
VHDPAAPGQSARPRRAQELHVQVGRGRKLARAKGRDERRAERVVEHRGQQAALDHADRVQEPLGRGERHLDRPGLGIDRHQLPSEQFR